MRCVCKSGVGGGRVDWRCLSLSCLEEGCSLVSRHLAAGGKHRSCFLGGMYQMLSLFLPSPGTP
jgi:hypothetical protein